MWFNKNSVFPAFGSGRTAPQREDNRGGLIRITFNSVLLSYSKEPGGIQFHSHQLQTVCLILVVVEQRGGCFTLQVPCEMTHGRREEAAFGPTLWSFSYKLIVGSGDSQLTLWDFRAQGKLPTWLCALVFAHQLSPFCFIQLSVVFDLPWSNVISSNIIYLSSESQMKLVARLILIPVNLRFVPVWIFAHLNSCRHHFCANCSHSNPAGFKHMQKLA